MRNNVLFLFIIRVEMNSQAGVGSALPKSQVLLYGYFPPLVCGFVFVSPLSLTGHRLLWFIGEAFGCKMLFEQAHRHLFLSRFTPFSADLMQRKKSLRG